MLKNVLEAIKWKNNYKKWNVKNEKNLKKTEFIKRKTTMINVENTIKKNNSTKRKEIWKNVEKSKIK